jgi:hypothetical protein
VGGMEDPTIQKINDYIDEFFFMEKGDLISYPNDNIALDKKSTLSKIGLKHIVESRKDDHYSAKEIKDSASRVLQVMKYPELDMPNTNKKYPHSRINGKAYPQEGRALLVIYQLDRGIRIVYNFYYRDINRFRRMR